MPKKDDRIEDFKPLDLILGVSKGLSKTLAAKANQLAKELSLKQELPPETGAEEGSDLDHILEHTYRLSFSATIVGNILETFEYKTGEDTTVRMVRIVVDRRIIEAICPKGFEPKSGSAVRLNKETNQIVGLAEELSHGPIATVREVSENLISVEIAGATRGVQRGVALDCSRGDRVVLDEMQLVIIGVLPKGSQGFTLTRAPKNSFEDIVGQDDAVLILKEVIDLDPVHDKIAQHYKRPRTKGVLAFGPPGCGKTMLGEAVADRMAKRHGLSSQGYFYVKGPDFLNMYVGETERGIRNCFEEADRHYKEHGFPATLVFDECEALLSKRGSGKNSDMEKTVVATFLGLMNDTTAFVMLMTNRVDTLDTAVIRDGRFDRQLFIGRPTRKSAEVIIAKNIAHYPLDPKGPGVDALAHVITEAFFDPVKRLVDEPFRLNDTDEYFTLSHVVNGAMLTRLVSDAVLIAERRDRVTGSLSGVSQDDLFSALDTLYAEKRKLNHDDELAEFFISLKGRLQDNVKKQTLNI